METDDFRAALGRVSELALRRPTCVMCAEAPWWRCHRRLIADALVVRGFRVLHLGLGGQPVVHELTPFAHVGPRHTLSYPPAQGTLEIR
jgi:uncharacterized protein (DUF488 family)